MRAKRQTGHPLLIVFFIASSFIFIHSCASEGQREEPAIEKPDAKGRQTTGDDGGGTIIEGTISMKGSMPRTYLACTTADGTEYKITGPLEEKLALEFQNKTVSLAGTIVREAVGPGFPAEFRVETIELHNGKKQNDGG